MSLSSTLMIGLFRSNILIVYFTKTEKKFTSQQTHKGPCSYDVLTFMIFHMFAGSIYFRKKFIGHFCRWREWCRSQNWSFLVDVINLEIQPIQLLGAAVSSSTLSHKPETFWQHREQTPAPTPTPPIAKPKDLFLSACT